MSAMAVGKFRVKPVPADAEQFFPAAPPTLARVSWRMHGGTFGWFAETARGPKPISPGDWLVRRADGAVSVMSDERFGAEFEREP